MKSKRTEKKEEDFLSILLVCGHPTLDGWRFSKLTNSNCPLFSAFFTSIFIPPNPLYRILFLDKKKSHLPVTFFDRLGRPIIRAAFLRFMVRILHRQY